MFELLAPLPGLSLGGPVELAEGASGEVGERNGIGVVDDLEVETFPTLLIGRGERLCFVGPVLPGPAAAQRLIQAAEENPAMSAASPTAPAGTTAAAQALLSRLRQSC